MSNLSDVFLNQSKHDLIHYCIYFLVELEISIMKSLWFSIEMLASAYMCVLVRDFQRSSLSPADPVEIVGRESVYSAITSVR